MKVLNKLKYFLVFTAMLASCEKFLETDLNDAETTSKDVFQDDSGANSAMAGLYLTMKHASFGGGGRGITLLCGLSADEFRNYLRNEQYTSFDENRLRSEDRYVGGLWREAYKTIYQANDIIEELANSKGVTPGNRDQLTGEALFIRAFHHFYLVNLFGDVPLVISTNYEANSLSGRNTTEEVYQQIIADLIKAQSLLKENYVQAERIRPNKAAATALLARVYLYHQDWSDAEQQATSLINNPEYTLERDLNNVFLKDNKEAIWQIGSSGDFNTFDGLSFYIAGYPSSSATSTLRTGLVNSFEPGDARKAKWVGLYQTGGEDFYFPAKYKVWSKSMPITEHYVILRLAEQYLIRAEARAHQDHLTGANGATADIDTVRVRAGLGVTTASTLPQILSAIEQEKRVELFTEGGHRWLDLNRWNRADAVLKPLKGENWQMTDMRYPIPQEERNKNPNLNPQNPGY